MTDFDGLGCRADESVGEQEKSIAAGEEHLPAELPATGKSRFDFEVVAVVVAMPADFTPRTRAGKRFSRGCGLPGPVAAEQREAFGAQLDSHLRMRKVDEKLVVRGFFRAAQEGRLGRGIVVAGPGLEIEQPG